MPSDTLDYRIEFREGPWLTLPPERGGGVYHYYVNIFPAQDIPFSAELYSTLEYLKNEGGIAYVEFGDSISFISARLGHYPRVKIFLPGMPQMLKVTVHWAPLRREDRQDRSRRSAGTPGRGENKNVAWGTPAFSFGQRLSADLERTLLKPVSTWSEKDVEAVMTERMRRPDLDPFRQRLVELERQWFQGAGRAGRAG